MIAISTPLVYTMKQLVDKAYTVILQTALYKTLCAEFKGMDPNNQTYTTFKEYMLQSFELRLQMGAPREAKTPCTTLPTTLRQITESIQNIQMANNTVAQTNNDNMSTITHNTADLQNLVEQMRQEQANYTYTTRALTPPSP